MNFWLKVYNSILNSEKLLEFWCNFPRDCRLCFTSVNTRIKSICRIIYFEKILPKYL